MNNELERANSIFRWVQGISEYRFLYVDSQSKHTLYCIPIETYEWKTYFTVYKLVKKNYLKNKYIKIKIVFLNILKEVLEKYVLREKYPLKIVVSMNYSMVCLTVRSLLSLSTSIIWMTAGSLTEERMTLLGRLHTYTQSLSATTDPTQPHLSSLYTW